MKYYLIGLIFFTVLSKVIAQIDRDVLLLRTTVYTREDAPQPNANVTVLQSGKTFSQTTSDAAGNVILKLPLNNDYTIIISKPGMLTKKFNVSTRGPVMGTEAKRYYEFEVEGIKIYEPFEGVDYSIFKQPLFTVTFDEKKNRFDVDKRSIEAVQSQINLVYQSEKDVEKKKKEAEKKYQDIIKNADAAFKNNKLEEAKNLYTQALSLKPNEQYPKNQIELIDKTLAELKAKQEAEAKAKAELEAKYQAAIKKGDEAFAKKDWTAAKAGYNEALGYKPNEKYPKDQLAAIEKAIADEIAQKKKQEEELKKQQELEAKYQAAIKKGDEAFAKKDWTTAKAGYNEALGYKPNEKYPKDQLAAIEKAIAESKGIVIKNQEKVDKEIKTNKEKSVKPVLGSDDKYKSVIKLADEYFNKQQYENAKTKYEEAMVYKPSDPYAKQKLLEIEKILNSDTKKNKKELSDRVKELIAKYPPGVTEKILVERDVTVYQRIVVKGDTAAYVYEKKVFGFGLIRYFRDGEPCTEAEFETETKLR